MTDTVEQTDATLEQVTKKELPVVSEEIASPKELSKDKLQKKEELKGKLDLKDGQSIISFGVEAQKQVTSVSQDMLNGVRNKDTGAAGEALNEMMSSVRGIDTDNLKNGEEPGFFGKLFGKLAPVAKFIQQYEEVESQIEKISDKLEKHRRDMLRDINMLDDLYESTLQYFHDLELYILAGEEKLQEIDEKVLPKMKKEAEKSGDMVKTQEANDMAKLRDDLERKVHDLKLTRQVTMQSLPSIRMTQDLDKSLVNKIQSTRINTIPMWQTQLAQAVTIARTRDAAKTVKDANDLNDQLLRANADNLHQATTEVRNTIEQGAFSIDAIEYANNKLIETIQDGVDTVNEGKQKRADAEKRLQDCESQLKQKLMEASA
jgi:uncharacterized protein YaaN involved in tellurite resistance